MNGVVLWNDSAVNQFVRALGLDPARIRSVTLRVAVNECVTVTAEILPSYSEIVAASAAAENLRPIIVPARGTKP